MIYNYDFMRRGIYSSEYDEKIGLEVSAAEGDRL
jgi:hypothetical protein